MLYLLMQAVSVGMGYLLFYTMDTKLDIFMTTFVILPITACSFGAFIGIWISNDYSGYEHDFLQGKDFQP